MIAYILMGIGGLLIVVSILGFLALIFEPLYKNYQIVIKRKDDYAHYTAPSTMALLRKARKSYCIGIVLMFLLGTTIFFIGSYMEFGSRGIRLILSMDADNSDSSNEILEDVLYKRLNKKGNFIDDKGTEYKYYFVIVGNNIYYGDKLEGSYEEFEKSFPELNINKSSKVYLVDGYASSATYKEVINYLNKNSYTVKYD